MTMPTMSVRRVLKLRAITFGRYPSAFAARITFAVVSPATRLLALNTRDTVDWDTPAKRATSFEVTGRPIALPMSFACRPIATLFHSLRTVASHAQIALCLVGHKAFKLAEPRAVLPDQCAGLGRSHLLIGHRLEEFADPQAACVARRATGRQRMVGADHFVAIGDVCFFAEEERTIIHHVLEKVARVVCEHLDMLVRQT